MRWSHGLLLAAIVAAGALGAVWWTSAGSPEPEAPSPPLAAASPADLVAPAPEAALERSGSALPDAAAAPPPAGRVDVSSDPLLRDRARQHELASAADARWEQAVDGAAYRAEDLDPAVRELFRRVDLEPRYAEGGRIEGLVIKGLAPDHPLARLGFRPGDRIDRIQGVPLRDPADLPSLLARLGPNFGVCVDRHGDELCREVHLE